jgi:fucose 4-O-acetylase-like acetyltransferase
MNNSNGTRPRLDWIDIARAYGMFLVFYGHFVETVFEFGNEPALLQEKLVYSFHMPLFIFISGITAKTDLPGLVPFLKKQTLTRLLPFVALSLLIFPFHILQDALDVDRGPSEILGRYVDDWKELCVSMTAPPEDPIAPARRHLWEQLPASTQQLLQTGATSDSLAASDRNQIAAAFNALLDKPDLFSDQLFADADLPHAADKQLNKDRTALTDSLELRCANWALTWWAMQPESRYWDWDQSPWSRLLNNGIVSQYGWPNFNVPTWFLLCLFMLELIHFFVARLLSSPGRIALAALFFAVAGWFATSGLVYRETFDFWFTRESLLLYSFYLLGMLLKRIGFFQPAQSRVLKIGLFLISAAILLFTFDLNPCPSENKPIVLINLSQHGDPLYFAITAIAGCLAVVALSRITPTLRMLQYIGRHSLILMGMNGIFFHFGNDLIVGAMTIPPNQLSILFWCTLMSVVTMAGCLPLIWLFDRYIPQLMGKPHLSGPLLPALLKRPQ